MVKHYRWDFIGLSTYSKPTPETSPKVVDGSTYYEADTSKLFVFCKGNWYEKIATGGGGGGGTVNSVNNVSPDSNGNVNLSPSDIGAQPALTAGSNITISGDTISATDTTYSDFSGATSGAAGSAGLVPAPASGETDKYLKSDGSWATVSQYSLPAATANTLGGVKIGSNLSMDGNDVLSATDTTYTAGTNVSISSGNVISATDTTYSNFVGTDGTAAGTAGLVPAPATTDAGKVLSASGNWTGLPDGIKTLTTADYNWPETDTKTTIALWKLKRGLYEIPAGVSARTSTTSFVETNRLGSIIALVNKANQANITLFGGGYYGMWCLNYVTNPTTGESTDFDDSHIGDSAFLTTKQVQNVLTSTATKLPLSANQGYVLNEKIEGRLKTNAGAPTTSTAGTLGQLLTDTANAKLYQLTAIDTTDPQNPSYTWSEVGGSSGPTVVQTTGTSTTDVMSQNAASRLVYGSGNSDNPACNDATMSSIRIGKNTEATGTNSVAIGGDNNRNYGAQATATNAVAIGPYSQATANYAIAIGNGARATVTGQFDIGTIWTTSGYNSSNYRLLTGLYDPQSAHDAATKGYVDNAVINGGTTAPTTSTVGAVGTQYTYVDTTGTPTAHLCVCTEIDNTDPSNPVYTWSTLI